MTTPAAFPPSGVALYDPPLPPSLDLPPAPPAPKASTPGTPPSEPALQRTYSLTRSLGSSFQSSIEEPTVDDLKRETGEAKTQVEEIISALKETEAARDRVIAARDGAVADCHKLALLTTGTGQKILALAAPLASVRRRAEALELLAKEGKAAATTLEVGVILEELAVLKHEVGKAVELVKANAVEEIEGKPDRVARLEQRIRRENPAMSDDGVKQAVQQAMISSAERISQLDVLSYAGRVACEQPFTELAVLLDNLSKIQKRGTTDDDKSETATLVGGMSEYAKLDLDGEGDLESAPFNSGGDGWAPPGSKLAKKSFWQRVKKNWRDWLVRMFLIGSVLGVIIGVVTWETLAASHAKDHLNSTTIPDGAGVPLGPSLFKLARRELLTALELD